MGLREEIVCGWGALEESGGIRLGTDARDVRDKRRANGRVEVNRANLLSRLPIGFGTPYDFRWRDEMAGWNCGLRGEQRE
jgi:hypothetical protein